MKDTYLNLNLPLTSGEHHDRTHIKVQVYYSLGGINMFTGKQDPRGIWVSVQPVKIETNSIGLTPTDGIRQFVIPLARKSQKQGDQQATLIRQQVEKKEGGVWSMVDHVLQRDNLQIAEPQAA